MLVSPDSVRKLFLDLEEKDSLFTPILVTNDLASVRVGPAAFHEPNSDQSVRMEAPPEPSNQMLTSPCVHHIGH